MRSVIGPGGGWWYHKIINLGPPRLPHHCCPRSFWTDPLSTVKIGRTCFSVVFCCFFTLCVMILVYNPPRSLLLPPSSNRIRAGKQTVPHRADMCRSAPPAAPSPAAPLRLYLRREKAEINPPRSADLGGNTKGPCYTRAPRLCLSDGRVLLPSPSSVPVVRSSYGASEICCVNTRSVSQVETGSGSLAFHNKRLDACAPQQKEIRSTETFGITGRTDMV